MNNEMLKGRVAIVTGGARGMGREFARGLASCGASVLVADLREASETVKIIEGEGGKASAAVFDVRDATACKEIAETAVKLYGGIDILVNNAALYADAKGGRFDSIPEDHWDLAMAINVKGIWNCCKAVVPHMRSRGSGSIINMSSLAAVSGVPFALPYVTSKAAVIGLTRGLARELGRDWIRVNSIAPTAVLTEGTRENLGERTDKIAAAVAQQQTLQRNLEPSDMIGTVCYLASDMSKFVTGQTLMVDGGTVYL